MPLEPPFQGAALAELQAELASAATMLAAIPAIGGSVWNRSTSNAGDGIHTRPGDVAAGQVVGNVYAQIPPAVAQALAGQPIPVATWWFVSDDTTTLHAGDKLTSVAEPALAFAVMGINRQPGYIVAGLNQTNARQL
jgi:hypothetical protein